MLEIVETQCDLLIIGSGGAALYAALLAANSDLQIVIATKAHPMQSNTAMAQGGISAALANVDEDSYQWHIYDTLKAAHGLADADSVEYMCKAAEQVIVHLSQFGVNFNKDEEGRIAQKIYGGHTKHYGVGGLAHRACYANDATGEAIIQALYSQLMNVFNTPSDESAARFFSHSYKSSLCFLNHHFAMELIRVDDHVSGCVFFDLLNLKLHIVEAKHMIIASGGYTKLYANSTSAPGSSGDGQAMAARSGIGLQDMEFIQFHPTLLYGTSILVSEAARAAGGVLMNSAGKRFMQQYSPQFLELSTRDIVSSAMIDQIRTGLGCGPNKDHILLDLRAVPNVLEKLPNLVANCKLLNIDPQKDAVPVVPGAHYAMGGIALDALCRAQYEDGKHYQPIKNLYVLGEAGCVSVHGAQRLGCNSLLECYAFGHLVIEQIFEVQGRAMAVTKYRQSNTLVIEGVKQEITLASGLQIENIKELWSNLQEIVAQHLGFMKDDGGIQEAIQKIESLRKTIEDFATSWANSKIEWFGRQKLKPEVIVQYLELKNGLICARAMAHSALMRKESRGAYSRIDYAKQDEQLAYHSFYSYQQNEVLCKPVRTLVVQKC
ncbi:putative SdhA-like FAD-binding protein [Rickettsiales endosymbiont of Paramecium tredecaurelia]|uniref:FAD-binding protein n=1 Tax=Candidatus Sarmatiella mevalonica TaxID=2770581 RepID=UPI001922D9CF|nr:putative SdhA-like FAD-binding protein [Candidatus Sarmatiella mevalonica]